MDKKFGIEQEDATEDRPQARRSDEYEQWLDYLKIILSNFQKLLIHPEMRMETPEVEIEEIIKIVQDSITEHKAKNTKLDDEYAEFWGGEIAYSNNILETIELLEGIRAGKKNEEDSLDRIAEYTSEYQRLTKQRLIISKRLVELEKFGELKLPENTPPQSENQNYRNARPPSEKLVNDFLKTGNGNPIVMIRDALAKNTFGASEDTPWPTASLNNGKVIGNAQLMPPIVDNKPLMPPEDQERWVQMMWKQREELSDLDADALDLLCHVWLKQANKPEDSAIAVIDDLLAMRNLKPKQGGNGRRGGYEPEQRTEMLHALSHIQNLWLNMGLVETYEKVDDDNSQKKRRTKKVNHNIQSRAFVVTDRLGQLNDDGYMDVERFIFQPGKLFAKFLMGPGQQTALLSAKAVEYDPYRQKLEKRLTRYLSWQWRIQATHGDYTRSYRVATILEAVELKIDIKHPGETRDRLERGLDRLQQDNVIAQWQYDPSRWNEEQANRRGWVNNWQQATIIVEPPDIIRESYSKIEQSFESEKPALKSGQKKNPEQKKNTEKSEAAPTSERITQLTQLAQDLKARRKTLSLSQLQLAEILEVTQGYLSKLEKGQVNITDSRYKHIRQWLDSADYQ
jgi:DNA-binding transcriptional regulator YiaG